MIYSVKTRTSKRVRIEISGGSLLSRLIPEVHRAIAKGASVYVSVPGGGDWSNTQLSIDEAVPLIITYELPEEELEALPE